MSDKKRYDHVVIRPTYSAKLDQICKEYGVSRKEAVEGMIQYYRQTRRNPKTLAEENPIEMIQSLEKRVISFHRTFEEKKLPGNPQGARHHCSGRA